MENRELSFRRIQEQDQAFLTSISGSSDEWSTWELGSYSPTFYDIEKWMNKYHYQNGEWRVWCLNKRIAFTYHLTKIHGEDPWLGTIVVEKKKQGFGRLIIKTIASEERKKGAKVLYAACPVQFIGWSQFLGKIGFEQYRVDYDEDGNEYLLLALPL